MQLVVHPSGRVRCLYGEDVNLAAFGKLRVTRASHVEPDADGWWIADLKPVRGPKLGPFERRSQALRAEREWLEQRWLISPPQS